MAKLTALQALNRVLNNIGESEVSGLTSLTTIQTICFNALNEAIDDICTTQHQRWKFLESLGSITMATSNYQYLISGLTSGSDLMLEDRETFRQPDNSNTIKYLSPQEFDALYPMGVTTLSGYPTAFTKYAGYFIFNYLATSTQNSKLINFRYWKLPAQYSTATATGTTDIPEPFDVTVIVNLATMRSLIYLGNNDAAVYKNILYGDGISQGSISKMKEVHLSPDPKPKMTFNVFKLLNPKDAENYKEKR